MESRFAAAIGAVLLCGVATAWMTEDPWAIYGLYIAVFLVGIGYLVSTLINRRPLILHPLQAVPATAALWALAQVALGISVNPSQSLNAALLWTANAVVFFVGTQIFSDRRCNERFRTALVYGGAALSVQAVLQLYTDDKSVFWLFRSTYHALVMGPVPYHNHFSALILLILPIALHRALTDSRRLFSSGVMAAAMAGAVFASESRSGTALVVAEVAAGVLLGAARIAKPIRVRVAVGLLVVSVIAGGVLVAGADRVLQRYSTGDSTRLPMDVSSLQMIRARPLVGFGLGAWPSVYPKFASFDDGLFSNQAHCDWLQWASEGGVGMALAMAWLGIALSVRAIRSVWGIGIPAVLLLGLIDFPFQKPIVALVFFAVASVQATADNG